MTPEERELKNKRISESIKATREKRNVMMNAAISRMIRVLALIILTSMMGQNYNTILSYVIWNL